MGVGFGFAIAAQLTYPNKRVLCIQGDSAFGFSAMELETVCRTQLPIICIIINNNGIYSGLNAHDYKESTGNLPSTALLTDARYEQVAVAFGAKGYCVRTVQELEACMHTVLSLSEPCVINVMIDPSAVRK